MRKITLKEMLARPCYLFEPSAYSRVLAQASQVNSLSLYPQFSSLTILHHASVHHCSVQTYLFFPIFSSSYFLHQIFGQLIRTFYIILWIHNLKCLSSSDYNFTKKVNAPFFVKPTSAVQKAVLHDLLQDDVSLYLWTYYVRNELSIPCCLLTSIHRLWHEHLHTQISVLKKKEYSSSDNSNSHTVLFNVMGARDITEENMKN